MKSVDTILKEIRYWINEYNKCADSASIDSLLHIQDQISIRSFTLAQYVSDYKTSFNAAYFIRKISIAKSTLAHQKRGLKQGQSDSQALVDNEEKYEHEQAHEATAVTLDLLLKQTNKILDAMAQRISYFKQEKQKIDRQNLT